MTELVVRADAAQREERWLDALDLWERICREERQPARAAGKRAEILLRLERYQEAFEAFAILAEDPPTRLKGRRGMALAAERSGAWEKALRSWESVLELSPDTPQAVMGKAKAILGLGRSEEAAAFLRRLQAEGADETLQLEVAVAIHTAGPRWSWDCRTLCRLLDDHEPAVSGDLRLLYLRLQCLLTLGQLDALPAALSRLPESERPPAGVLVYATYAAFGRPGLRTLLLPLLSPSRLARLPADLLPTAIAAAEGLESAPEALARLEGDGSFDCDDKRLPLMAPFAAALHDSLGAFRGAGMVPAPAGPPLEERFLAVLRKRSGSYPAEDRLLRAAESFRALRASSRAFHPDVAVSLDDALSVADRIVEAATAGEPLSLLRLGDGEGHFVPCREELRQNRRGDQAFSAPYNGGMTAEAEHIAFLEQELTAAFHDADIVGIAPLDRFLRSSIDRNGRDGKLADRRSGRGLLRGLDFALSLAATPAPRAFTSCNLHQALCRWRLWDLLLAHLGTCSLITSHPDLAARLRQLYGIETGQFHLLPDTPEGGGAGQRGEASAAARHFPERFRELSAGLTARPGEVFLVSAGTLGKIYCRRIKAAGGIAIDIGSLADHWCGLLTRPWAGSQLLVPHVESVACYRRLAEKDARVARLLRPAR